MTIVTQHFCKESFDIEETKLTDIDTIEFYDLRYRREGTWLRINYKNKSHTLIKFDQDTDRFAILSEKD